VTSIRDREVVTFYAKDGTKIEVPIERDPRLGPNEVEIHSGQGSWRFDTRTAHVVVTDSSPAVRANPGTDPSRLWGYPVKLMMTVGKSELDVTGCLKADAGGVRIDTDKLLTRIDQEIERSRKPFTPPELWSEQHPVKLHAGLVEYVRTEMPDEELYRAERDVHHVLYDVAHGNLWRGHVAWPLYALLNEELAFRGLVREP
jgi:hypothetical protein